MAILEMIIFVLTITFAIVFVVRRGDQREADRRDEMRENQQILLKEMQKTRKRLDVLERLATDEDRILARKFNSIDDPRNAH